MTSSKTARIGDDDYRAKWAVIVSTRQSGIEINRHLFYTLEAARSYRDSVAGSETYTGSIVPLDAEKEG